MAQLEWSIRIITTGSGGYAFQPNLPGAKPGQQLQAQGGDIVSFRNDTTVPQQPWPTAGNLPNGTAAATADAWAGSYSNVLAPGNSSDNYVVPNAYCFCLKSSPAVQGYLAITVSSPPPAPKAVTINIIEISSGLVFQVSGGQTLGPGPFSGAAVAPGDTVTWVNKTTQTLQPWPTTGNIPGAPAASSGTTWGGPYSAPLASGASSAPFKVTSPTLWICLKATPSVMGSIQIVPAF